VPGFSFVFVRRALLAACERRARSLSLDLYAQWKGFAKNGQFRYTPPTHAVLAFDQALDELEAEGGVAARAERYRRNHETLLAGMRRAGFRPLLAAPVQSPIITAFRYPTADFDFAAFYRKLSDRGFIIYPGKLTQVDTFRVGNIGRLFPADFEQLTGAAEQAMREMAPSPP
jgi:2-aminoethylphosphonate-pyruvate transaminase